MQISGYNTFQINQKVKLTTMLGLFNFGDWFLGELSDSWLLDEIWEVKMDVVEREDCYRLWKRAVSKTFDWV